MHSPHQPSPSSTSSPQLSALGWDETFAALFTEHAAAGLIPARIVRVDRGRCDTLTAAGPVRADNSALIGPDREHTACTGDWAALRPGPQPRVETLLPRRTAIMRASSDRTSHRQVLAANIDTVLIAVSLATPVNAGRIERLLALTFDSGARPVIVLTKADLADHPGTGEAVVSGLASGVDILTTSTVTGLGLERLAATVSGTAVLLGPSGAGKSSLTNALLGREQMDTDEVRAVDGKGRHTTVHRELSPLPTGGVLIDTPGLRGIGVQDVADGVGQVFAEIDAYARTCAFGDCDHRSEPGCAVQDAIVAGELDLERLDRYRKLMRESERAATRGDARRNGKRSKTAKAITRELRATYRFRDRGF